MFGGRRFGRCCFAYWRSGLIALGFEESRLAFRWWWTFSLPVLSVSDLILLRLLAPSIWCVVLNFSALLAARRRAQIWRSPTT